MQITWDENKAASNLKKHRGVSFDEAATCLLDPMALVVEDPDAEGEQRFILTGEQQCQLTDSLLFPAG